MSTLVVENLKGPTTGANANKIIVPSGQTLDASNGFTAPAGHVLQIKWNQNTAWTTTTSTSGIDALTCSITPSATTSNVLVILHLNGIRINGLTQYGKLDLYRDSTLIKHIHDLAGYQTTHTHYTTDIPSTFYDTSISTTSSVTYKLTVAISSSSADFGFNNYGTGNNRTTSSITLMEIAG